MKKILTLLFAFTAACGTVNAQTTLTQAVDFTVTDIDGNSHTLFNILSSGKYVCLDFFFVNCGPCQQTSPYYKQTYQNFGCNSGDVFFMAIDLNDNTAAVQGFETTYLGGPAGYPVVSGTDGGGGAVCSAYGISAYPTYILIAPNHAIVEQDMWPISSAATFTTYLTSHGINQMPCPTSIPEQALPFAVHLFPNPASDQLTIGSAESMVSFQVMDLAGKTVMSENLSQGMLRHSIDIQSLSSGMYFIRVNGREGRTMRLKFQKL